MFLPQIKTIEKHIINNLNNPKVHASLVYVFNHFADEDFLHNYGHTKILTAIYLNNLYKHKSVRYLCIHLNIDNKTLLHYRKLYVSLFARFEVFLQTFLLLINIII